MKSFGVYVSLKGSAHTIPKGHKYLGATPAKEKIGSRFDLTTE
jgi:hypothetical protein